ncbi:hypothetical protein HMPREF9506_00395 [Enterococcus faecalis TX0309A]|nr:hypothetical protein HMPREF9504_00306 [Enterococcus faecalis TX0102]EFT43040.1 hypothetical protein HMPREF9500_03084 [Enterococcus faecalis TX0017]EFU05338.1 hypothetical protein HMPREF9513_02149 [Enterococcus faecalis TX0645]EFU94680.1 hypothetical protein HMPREF9506_00395 [Enterococcus faecalis TX0309A]EJU90211.1 hypothetical protein HMPREF1327_01570 [Enterococcus faecalis 599]EJU99494.1 hypothetical protein HMPREF1330_01009 [Enterococcus faecalis ERV129]EJV04796.1 hypothetical protein H
MLAVSLFQVFSHYTPGLLYLFQKNSIMKSTEKLRPSNRG